MRAILEHERYHVRNIDPLKAAIMRVLSQALYFLPALDLCEQAGAAAISSPDLLDVRLRQLESGSEPKPEALDAKSVILSLGAVALFAVVFLVSVSDLGGATAVYHATGTGLVAATGLDTLTCTAPFAGAGLLMCSLVAAHASRPLTDAVYLVP